MKAPKIPDNYRPQKIATVSGAVGAAMEALAGAYPGFRFRKPSVYTVEGEERATVALRSAVMAAGEPIAEIEVRAQKYPNRKLSRRWEAGPVELLAARKSPVTPEEAEAAAARVFTHEALVGRPMDPEMASDIAKMVMARFGPKEEEPPKKEEKPPKKEEKPPKKEGKKPPKSEK